MYTNYQVTCSQCGKKLELNDPKYSCDGCGRVYCPHCKEHYLAITQGNQHYTRLLCPWCLDNGQHRVINRTINN